MDDTQPIAAEKAPPGLAMRILHFPMTRLILGIVAFAIASIVASFVARTIDPSHAGVPRVAAATVTAVIALAISISLFVTILSVYSAFRQADPDKLIVVSSFGASKWQQFSKVVFPSAVPAIIATLKVNIGLSLIGAIVGEFLAANAGLGYLIIYGQNIFNMSLVMTSLVILTVIAGIMYYAVALLERALLPWRRE